MAANRIQRRPALSVGASLMGHYHSRVIHLADLERRVAERPAPPRSLLAVEALCLLLALSTLGQGSVDALDFGLLLLPAHLHRILAVRGQGLLIAAPAGLIGALELACLASLRLELTYLGGLTAFGLALIYAAQPGDPLVSEDPAGVLPHPQSRVRDGFFLLLAGYGALSVVPPASLGPELALGFTASGVFLVVAFEALHPARDESLRAALRRFAACGLLFLLPLPPLGLRVLLGLALALATALALLGRRVPAPSTQAPSALG